MSAFAAVNKGLQPIKADLATIKTQLDQIGTTLEDLSNRAAEIEGAAETGADAARCFCFWFYGLLFHPIKSLAGMVCWTEVLCLNQLLLLHLTK